MIFKCVICFIYLLLSASSAFAVDYYMSTTGSDANDGLSLQNAWGTFLHADNTMIAGDVLLIEDGTYDDRIIIHHSGDSVNGPITYRAINDFMVTLEPTTAPLLNYADATLVMFSCPGCGGGLDNPQVSYITIEGIIFRGYGEHNTVQINSRDDSAIVDMTNNIVLRKCGFFGTYQEGNGAVVALGNGLRDSLIEDVFSYGKGRKAMEAFGCVNVTIRRAVVRYDYWEGDDYKPADPRTTFSGYNTVDSIFENMIAIDSAPQPPGYGSSGQAGFAASGNETPAAITNSSNNHYMGMIAVNVHGNGMVSNGGSGDPNTGMVFDNFFTYNNWPDGDGLFIEQNNDGAVLTNITSMTNGLSGVKVEQASSANVTNIEITNSYASGNGAYGYYYASANVSVFSDNTAINNSSGGDIEASYAPDYSVRLLDPVKVAGHERGATIVNRYVDGVQTSTPLWPYPYEDIIKQHMCNQADLEAVHRWDDTDPLYVNTPAWCQTNKTLTEFIWEINGAPCPADICNAVGPVRSAGSPTTEQPSGTTQITMSPSTDVEAACKYGEDGQSGIAYDSLAYTMNGSGTTNHSILITGLSDGNSYSRAIRCQKTSDNEQNNTDYTLMWSVANAGSVCDQQHPNLCNTESDCTGAGLNWCSGTCQVAACGGSGQSTTLSGIFYLLFQ